MDNKEEKLIKDIRDLFLELIVEEEERFDAKSKRVIYPSKSVYVDRAKKLYKKALELETINSNFSTFELKDVMSNEIGMVERFEYEYKGNVIKPKSITKIEYLMRDTTRHIQLYFFDVLGDIKIE